MYVNTFDAFIYLYIRISYGFFLTLDSLYKLRVTKHKKLI
jgi:hypothetical protein